MDNEFFQAINTIANSKQINKILNLPEYYYNPQITLLQTQKVLIAYHLFIKELENE